jgi:hypothetical protein
MDSNRSTIWTSTVLWVGVIVVFVTMAARLINLDADPVAWNKEVGYQIDEGFKTLSPRNLKIFGTTHWNPEDQYPGWMNASPATQWPYYLAFRLFGPELRSARVATLAYATILMGMAALLLFKRLAPGPALIGIILLAADPGLFLYSRSALFETSIAVCLYFAIFASSLVPHQRHILAAGIILIIGILGTFAVKKSVILYTMAPMAATLALGLQSSRQIRAKQIYRYVAVAMVGIIAAILLATRHIWVHKLGLTYLLATPQLLFLNPLPEVSPISLIFGYVVLLDLILRRPADLFRDRYRLCLASVIVLVPLAFGLFRYHPTRYFIPVIPATLLLAAEWLHLNFKSNRVSGSGVHRAVIVGSAIVVFMQLSMVVLNTVNHFILPCLPIPQGEDPGIDDTTLLWLYLPFLAGCVLAYFFMLKSRLPRIVKPTVIVLIVAQVTLGAAVATVTLFYPSYESSAIRQKLIRIIPKGESVGGDWAPFFTAGSKIPALYMRPSMNSAAYVRAIRPDYFLYSDSWYDQQTYQALRASREVVLSEPIQVGLYKNQEILLYPLHYFDSSQGNHESKCSTLERDGGLSPQNTQQ